MNNFALKAFCNPRIVELRLLSTKKIWYGTRFLMGILRTQCIVKRAASFAQN